MECNNSISILACGVFNFEINKYLFPLTIRIKSGKAIKVTPNLIIGFSTKIKTCFRLTWRCFQYPRTTSVRTFNGLVGWVWRHSRKRRKLVCTKLNIEEGIIWIFQSQIYWFSHFSGIFLLVSLLGKKVITWKIHNEWWNIFLPFSCTSKLASFIAFCMKKIKLNCVLGAAVGVAWVRI